MQRHSREPARLPKERGRSRAILVWPLAHTLSRSCRYRPRRRQQDRAVRTVARSRLDCVKRSEQHSRASRTPAPPLPIARDLSHPGVRRAGGRACRRVLRAVGRSRAAAGPRRLSRLLCHLQMLLQHRQGLLGEGFELRVLERVLLLPEVLDVLLMIFDDLIHESLIKSIAIELLQLLALHAFRLAGAGGQLHALLLRDLHQLLIGFGVVVDETAGERLHRGILRLPLGQAAEIDLRMAVASRMLGEFGVSATCTSLARMGGLRKSWSSAE